MDSLIDISSGKAVVTTKQIAKHFGKPHRTVLRNIQTAECDDNFREHNFVLSSYTSEQNKTLPCYELTRDGFAFIAMGFTGKNAAKWKIAYIRAFNEMESTLNHEVPTMRSINEIVRIAENDKQLASEHGRELAKYKKVKREHQDRFESAAKSVQFALGFPIDKIN